MDNKKKEILEKLYAKKESKKEDKNQVFIDRVKVYFILDLIKQGTITSEKASEIFSKTFTLEYFIKLITPKIHEIDKLILEKLLEKF